MARIGTSLLAAAALWLLCVFFGVFLCVVCALRASFSVCLFGSLQYILLVLSFKLLGTELHKVGQLVKKTAPSGPFIFRVIMTEFDSPYDFQRLWVLATCLLRLGWPPCSHAAMRSFLTQSGTCLAIHE